MSAKKKEKVNWSLCGNCECLFTKQVFSKHQKSCCSLPSLSDPNDSSISVSKDTAFIKDGVFHGIVQLVEEELVSTLPSLKHDVVLMHPSTLKACNLQVASLVLLMFGEKRTYGVVWPSSSVDLDAIHLKCAKVKTLNIEANTVVEVHKPETVIISADKVVLEALSLESETLFSTIKDILLSELDDTSITVGDIVYCLHYGETLSYKVRGVNCDTAKITDVKPENFSFIEQHLNDLSLTSDSQKFSTPKKTESLNFRATLIAVNYVLFHHTQLQLMETKTRYPAPPAKVYSSKEVEMVGGYEAQKKLLRELVGLPLVYPELYRNCGVTPPRGLILYGPNGTGKSYLVRLFLKDLSGVYSKIINGPELTSKFLGETENNLRKIFDETMSKAPSVLIIDDFDSLCPSKTSSSNDTDRRIVATLSSLMDGIDHEIPFVVLAITNKLDSVDISVRRPGRFDKEIEMGVPNVKERLDILKKIVCCKHSLSESHLIELSEITHGYVGADLSSLCREAGLCAINNVTSHSNLINVENLTKISSQFSIQLSDFNMALCKVGPSAMKEVSVDIPKVYWTDVGGQEIVKQKLREAIEWPLKHPEVFTRMGISPPRGLLMYGPPGCSKTLMAKALATESGLNFISIKGPELFNKYLGESEKAVRDVFQKARVAAPSIIFFDEIDAIGVQRSGKDSGGGNAGDRVLAQILTELDGVEGLNGVIVVAATNRPDVIDPALMRPGRIDRLIHVPLPDNGTREEIFKIQFRSIPIASEVDIDTLVRLSQGYSGAEICSLCREAALFALRENFDSQDVAMGHFENIFNQIKPATTEKMMRFYDDYAKRTTGSF